MTGNLEDKIVLVTGAANGMGRSHCALLAERGAHVIVHDVDARAAEETADLVRDKGRKVALILEDIQDLGAMRAGIASAVQSIGPVDVLVNNAGVSGMRLALEDIDESTFDRMFAVHVKGAFFVTQAVLPAMKRRRRGKIINITSNFAMGGSNTASHYAAAKSALAGLTKSWARELARYNITVNAVAPGLIETNMTLGSVGKEGIERMAKEVPLGRIAAPLEISYAVAWLASPETDFMTGQVVAPNGGIAIVGI